MEYSRLKLLFTGYINRKLETTSCWEILALQSLQKTTGIVCFSSITSTRVWFLCVQPQMLTGSYRFAIGPSTDVALICRESLANKRTSTPPSDEANRLEPFIRFHVKYYIMVPPNCRYKQSADIGAFGISTRQQDVYCQCPSGPNVLSMWHHRPRRTWSPITFHDEWTHRQTYPRPIYARHHRRFQFNSQRPIAAVCR